MYDIRIINDLEQCRDVWKRAMGEETIWDLWDVRACFDEHYRRPAHFIVAEGSEGPTEILPLSWIDESQCYGYFPGETWQGKTWLEQNRIPADKKLLQDMLDRCPGHYYLRYLAVPADSAAQNQFATDEVGYLFRPADYNYDMENYFQQFSRKSEKGIKREVAALLAGASYRYDKIEDFECIVNLNIKNFGADSYFYDQRFQESFRSLAHYLYAQGWLRMTTVMINQDIAAVDIGCVYRGNYTLLGGGTNRDYPGIAKLINLHHMQRGCEEKFKLIDFLCGDFSWKKKFHLTERPLHLLTNFPAEPHLSEEVKLRKAEYVK